MSMYRVFSYNNDKLEDVEILNRLDIKIELYNEIKGAFALFLLEEYNISLKDFEQVIKETIPEKLI